MTPIITAGIQAKLTENEFNNGYKLYQQLKELLQSMGETQFIRLIQEYYPLSFQNFENISRYLDYIKRLRE